jgi:phospholipase C
LRRAVIVARWLPGGQNGALAQNARGAAVMKPKSCRTEYLRPALRLAALGCRGGWYSMRCGVLFAGVLALAPAVSAAASAATLSDVETIVVIYAENRSFDNLYGFFPGANGLANLKPADYQQVDRDGSVLKELPPIWGGITKTVPQEKTAYLPNAPFAIDDPNGLNVPFEVTTKDLWHKFYQNQMQIDGGKNDRFAAWADAGGLVMGHYAHAKLPLEAVAKEFVLADNFFMGAFGGSFLNHFWLVCACTPTYPNAADSPAKGSIAAVEDDKFTLKPKPESPVSALDGIPKFVNDGALTPDFYAINTMQPPYQPSGNKPAEGGDPAFADPAKPNTLPPQTERHIGDLLSEKGVGWVWYAGAMQAALDGKNADPVPNYQYHHNPLNYFKDMAPGTPARAEHLRDGGLGGAAFIDAIDGGKLPAVTFYKPQGNLNEHPGYADVLSGDEHIATLIEHLRKSPQWQHMVVVVTYDENGGLWDHVAPPKADRWGPGTRIPALVVSPLAKKGVVDHTLYDTTSILRLITKRFGLPKLPGLDARDAAIQQAGGKPLGDLTAALDITPP